MQVNSQSIPFGNSQDSITIPLVDYYSNDSLNLFNTSYELSFYKPSTYDSLTSPVLIYIHSLSGPGGEISYLQGIADRRNALIVEPTMHNNWPYVNDYEIDNNGCYHFYWLQYVLKSMYKYTINRENRNTMDVYLTGFSAGGQFVTRYMLIRQGIPDSIPIKMAVSVNPASYTFCTDTLNSIYMDYPCGISGNMIFSTNPSICTIADTFLYPFTCNEHIIQYYNENYGVLIGTADTANFNPGWQCMDAQGQDRYERARNFYNFSDTNAITRGTTLQWKYDSVIGVDHNANLMYNTKRNVTDTSTIAETLLFDTPWHPVPSIAPIASFTADTTIVTLPTAAVQFTNNSINATSYLWDFGDGTTSTAVNPLYIYTYADTFTVKLTATSGSGCDNTMIKRNYIIVKNANGVSQISNSEFQISIYPNPTSGKIQVAGGSGSQYKIEIYNVFSELVYSTTNLKQQTSNEIDLSPAPAGIYFIELKTSKGNYHRKIIKE